MTFELEDEVKASFDFDVEALAKQLINACIDYVDCPYECEVNLTLTDNDGIHRINKEFRQIDSPTDVLSFPLVDYDEPACFDSLEEGDVCYFNPDSGELMLGDIVISVDKVKAQAVEYGHSEKREFSFLIVHSMLHLFGYDHMEDEERLMMEDKQKDILEKEGITR